MVASESAATPTVTAVQLRHPPAVTAVCHSTTPRPVCSVAQRSLYIQYFTLRPYDIIASIMHHANCTQVKKNYVHKIVLIKIYDYKVPSKQLGISPSEIYIKHLVCISEILLAFYIWEIQDFFVYMTDQRLPSTSVCFINFLKVIITAIVCLAPVIDCSISPRCEVLRNAGRASGKAWAGAKRSNTKKNSVLI
jgi:hypothetical protein